MAFLAAALWLLAPAIVAPAAYGIYCATNGGHCTRDASIDRIEPVLVRWDLANTASLAPLHMDVLRNMTAEPMGNNRVVFRSQQHAFSAEGVIASPLEQVVRRH